MKQRFNTKQFIQYFSEYDAESWLQELFIGIENDLKVNILPYYDIDMSTNSYFEHDEKITEKIGNLCREYDLQNYESYFFVLSLIVNGMDCFELKYDAVDYVKLYQRELFSIFDAFVTIDNGKVKKKEIPEIKIKAKFNLTIKNDVVLQEYLNFICDCVTRQFLQHILQQEYVNLGETGFHELPFDDQVELINYVKQFLIDTNPKKGQPNKALKRKQFIVTIEKFIIDTIPVKFDSGRQSHLFIGKLTCLYGIIPEPGKYWKGNEDEYYIKTIENLLPNK